MEANTTPRAHRINFPSPRLILFVALLLACAPTFSQAPAPGGQDMLIQERQKRLLEEQQRRLEELKRLPGESESAAPTPAQPEAPGACINIERIQVEGADQLTESLQRGIVAPFEGQCLDSGKLNDLLGAITQAYLDRGLITSRAYLPPQDPTDGTLTVKVIEGRLEGFESSGKPSQREIWMSFPGKTGEVLNVRELEQMLDQLGRLPSRASTLDLLPGTEPGMSKVEVKNEPQKSWRGGVRYDNTGFKSTGEYQMGAYLVWDSPLGLADQLSLSAGRDDHQRQWGHPFRA